jgi:hypothetical protein
MRFSLAALVAVTACKSPPPPTVPAPPADPVAPAPADPLPPADPAPVPVKHDQIARAEFNRFAVRQNVPVYWIADANADNTISPDETAALLFYPTSPIWVHDGTFTKDFERAYTQIVKASQSPGDLLTDDGKRRELVGQDLDQGRPTLVATTLDESEKAFVTTMMLVAREVDALYERMNGARAVADKLPADPESRSMFRRNRGPACVGPLTEKNPACSAIPGAPKPIFDLYPAELQTDEKFCKTLEAHADAKTLLSPFTVVRGTKAALTAVPYTTEYKDGFSKISILLLQAASQLDLRKEGPLVAYLKAAAQSFQSNDWAPADEAWAKMNVDNSAWYVRIAPDEVYWEPCASKAGLHLTFARINQGSRAWQQKLVPVQQEMENAIAKLAGAPYKAHPVTFHLPDFIDIVINAGDDRDPLGATIGQSLPNWGAVANEGRGRTIAMVNLWTDADSVDSRRAQANSMLDRGSMQPYTGTLEPGLLSTILHEVTHNLGPSHEYTVGGKKAGAIFGGPLASVMEELKAQSGALFLLEFLRKKKLITDELAQQSYADSVVWALGHISQGMYTATGERKTYSNVAAMQIGYLIDKGALIWDPTSTAANGSDKGALKIVWAKLVPAANQMMKDVAGIKARGDKKAAEAMAKKYVDGTVVPHAIIQERFRRQPRGSLVYSVK